MSRLPIALARRVDRLSRQAHAFHRFAHHPLCDRYSDEVVTFGSKCRLCRGCLSAAMGLGIGATVGICLPQNSGTELVQLGIAAALALISLKVRLSKFNARFLPAAFGSAATAAALRRACTGDTQAPVIVAAGLLLGACGFVVYRKHGPNRGPCVSCPERERLATGMCSGIAPITRRERAFQRLAQRWLDAAPK